MIPVAAGIPVEKLSYQFIVPNIIPKPAKTIPNTNWR
ncbi:uncharacterized protein METZ01_LOCUS256267, partial [marine metagenome]